MAWVALIAVREQTVVLVPTRIISWPKSSRLGSSAPANKIISSPLVVAMPKLETKQSDIAVRWPITLIGCGVTVGGVGMGMGRPVLVMGGVVATGWALTMRVGNIDTF